MVSEVRGNTLPDWRGHLPKVLGLAGLLCVAYAGALQLSYWTVPLGGLLFAAESIAERRAHWRYALSASNLTTIAHQLLLTAATQIAVVAIFYLLFFGLGTIVTGHADFSAFGLHEVSVLGLMAFFFCAAALLKDHLGAPLAPADTLAILDQISVLSSSPIVMPDTIFQIASQIARQKLVFAVALIEQCAANEGSFHVRRVAYTALRFMGLRDNPLLDVRAFLDRGFADSHPWVRYDAVFTAEVLGFDDPALRAKLAGIADGMEPFPNDASLTSNDALLQSRVKAARFLRQLEGAVAA